MTLLSKSERRAAYGPFESITILRWSLGRGTALLPTKQEWREYGFPHDTVDDKFRLVSLVIVSVERLTIPNIEGLKGYFRR